MMTLGSLRALAVAAFTLTTLTAACSSKVENSQHVAAIRQTVEGTPSWLDRGEVGKRLWQIERQFYEARGFMPAWVDGDGTTDHWNDLVQQLAYSERHGLDPAAYGPQEFERLRDASQTRTRGTRFPVERIPEMDARMTYAYLRYAADLLGWTRSARQVHPTWLAPAKKEDLAARLSAAIAGNRVRDSLEELAPTHTQYKGLQAALARGQQPDRVEHIKMNMERWRWAPRDLGQRYILINVPSYQLQVMEGEQPALSMRVIVGQPDHQTPIFSDEMTYVVFSPYWNIPPDILREETLPRVVSDPDYLQRNNIEVVGPAGKGEVLDPEDIDWSDEDAIKGLRFRQAPGPENALGLVKFIFPNHFNVYLHDTPGDTLFFKEHRTFSHGCIRVEQPVELARYVLGGRPEWTESRIRAAMGTNKEETVTLERPLRVHIGYWTAWVEPDGKTVTFTDDPYGLDPRHARLRGATL